MDEDIIDVFLLYNNKKVKSVNPNKDNYFRIIAKDIGVQNDFKELTFVIVNDIELTINIKFKNKFSNSLSMSVKDRLKFFNQKVETKKPENQYIPKKLKMPNFLQKEEPKKIENTPKKESIHIEENKSSEEISKKEDNLNQEENTNQEEKQNEEIKNEEQNQNEEKQNEEIKNEEDNKEEQNQKEEEVKYEETNKEKEKEIKNEEVNKEEDIKNKEVSKEEEAKHKPKIKKEEKPKEEKTKEEKPKEEKEIEKPQQSEEIPQEKEKPKNDFKHNYFKQNETSQEQNKPRKIPGKLKIPEAFLFIQKDNSKIHKKETKPKVEEKINKIEKEEINTAEENNNKNETPKQEAEIEKKVEEQKPKEEIKPQEIKEQKETKRPSIEKINNNELKKSKTSKEPELSKEMRASNPLPSISEKDDFIIIDEFEDVSNTEIFLEPSTYGEFLKDQKSKGIKHPYRETFCEGFFIASFPQKDGKVIEMSESFPAPCKHEICSKLPAMKPEIIFRYPLEDTKTLELNNLAATICFPTGIKVCYDENNDPANIKDYVTSITNQKGERYYMMTYHFYLKILIDEYQQYEEHPLKYNLRKFADAYTGLSEEELNDDLVNKIQENLEFCQELGFRDTVCVPFCICLISKYPYVREMQKCLNSIYTILNKPDDSGVIINDLIMYLIHAIPIPAKNTKVKFLIPYFNNCIEIDCPKLEDINIMNGSATALLKYFTIDNLILIFRLLITEKKILIIDEDYEKLSNVADGFISILYPFQWIHTYIPIMSDQMLKYLETFLPFLNGINKSLMGLVENVFKEGEVEEEDEVFLIYISEERDKIRLSSSLKGKKKRLEKYVSDNIPALPWALEKDLRNKLKKSKYEVDDMVKYNKKKLNIELQNIELQIRDAFIDFFVEMFHDYAQYLSFLEEDTVFNKSLFLEKRQSEKKFYNEILDTQLFQQFTQNVINEDVGYFNSKIALREENSKNKPLKNKENIKQYCINPDFLEIENKSNNMKELVSILKNKYPEKNNKNDIRILEQSITIENSKYNSNDCKIYMTPEEKEVKKEEKHEEKQDDKPQKKIKIVTNNSILQKIKMMNLNVSNNVKRKEGLTEKEKDNLKETIKDYVVKIFKSEELNLEQKEKTELLNKLNLDFGRDFFISLLSKNSSNVILLKDNSFHILWTLIYNCIINTLKLEETSKIIEDIALLIKSTKFFGITENGATLTMFEKNKQKIQGVPKITQDNFWQSWFDTELKKNDEPKNEDKQEIIYDICKTLIELEMPKSMVKKITDNINIKQFGKGSEMHKKTFDVFIKFIINAKYVSKAI